MTRLIIFLNYNKTIDSFWLFHWKIFNFIGFILFFCFVTLKYSEIANAYNFFSNKSRIFFFYTTSIIKLEIKPKNSTFSRRVYSTRTLEGPRLRFESFENLRGGKTQDKQSHSNSADIIANPSRSSLLSSADLSLSLSLVLPRRSKTQQVIIQTFERREQSPLRAETEAQSGPSSFPRVISPKSVPPSPLRVDCSTLLILSAIFAARIPSSCEEGRSIKI